jgi:hypothetical protein
LWVAILLSTAAAQVIGQSPSSDDADWVQIDPDPQRTSAGETVSLSGARYLALSAERSGQLEAVRILERMFTSGSIDGGDEEAISILRQIVGESVTIVVVTGSSNYPLVRMQAVRLLARLGGSEAAEILYSVIERDEEPAVVAEAVLGVSSMESSPEERFYDLITARIRKMTVTEPNDRLADAILEAVTAMHEDAWAVEDPDLYEAIIGIARGRYVPAVRRKAIAVLEMLRDD